MARTMAIMLLHTFLAACKHAQQSDTPPVRTLPLPGIQLIATPNQGPVCGASGLHIHFDWIVSSLQSPTYYDLHIDSPIGRTFASSRHVGHADTGNWAYVGQWFFLVAPETHEVVAAVRIGPDNCM